MTNNQVNRPSNGPPNGQTFAVPSDTSAEAVGKRAHWRVFWRLIPFLFFLYILAYLDRVNVGVAGLKMKKPLSEGGMGFDEVVLGWGFGIFFLGYWILEIPSTVSVIHWGARWVFVRILILWGICAALVGTIGTPLIAHLVGWIPPLRDPTYQFYFFRFMLGFFEGGFFPSVIVYLSLWFRTEDRAKAIAAFMVAIPLSSAFGNQVSGFLLEVHWFGWEGWRWIFILQGIAPILAGFAAIFLLPDRPATAKWLPPDERAWLMAELDREHQGKAHHGHAAWVHHLGSVLLLTLIYLCLNITSYGLQSFMPAILQSQSGTSDLVASLLSSLPYAMAVVSMLLNGWHSDRTGERLFHVAVPLALLSLGLFMAAELDGHGSWPILVMVIWVGACVYAHLPAYWTIPTMFLGGATAASAIGFINMIGNLGGFLGPVLVGAAAKGQTSFAPALMRIAIFPVIGAVIVLAVGYLRRKHPISDAPEAEAVMPFKTAAASPPK
jgi:ACS family tartrate transporter-like MFS transporter